MNNIANTTLAKPLLFADDTCSVLSNTSISNLESNCNRELTKVLNWCNANKLQINPVKSTAVLIPSKLNAANVSLNLVYNDETILCRNSCKYLGVTIDNRLSFQLYIQNILRKFSRSVGIVGKLRFLLPRSSLLLLYYSLIHPHFLFGLPLWEVPHPPIWLNYREFKIKLSKLSQVLTCDLLSHHNFIN